MIFWNSAIGGGGGGGVIFNPKIYVADFENFKQGFLSMKLIQKIVSSGFRVSFLTIVFRKIRIGPISYPDKKRELSQQCARMHTCSAKKSSALRKHSSVLL